MKKKTEDVKFGGGTVRFIGMKALVKNCCALCGKDIKLGKKIYVVIPAGVAAFPNCRVHHKCTKPTPPFDTNHRLVWAAAELAKSWKEAQKYAHWFMD